MIVWFMEFLGAESGLEVILFSAAGIGAIVALWVYGKKFIQALRKTFRQWDNIHDSLVGAGPIKDPETGEVLREERLPLVTRVANLEDTMGRIADVLASMTKVENDLASILEWQRAHEEFANQLVKDLQAENEKEHERLWKAITEVSS